MPWLLTSVGGFRDPRPELWRGKGHYETLHFPKAKYSNIETRKEHV